MKDKIKIAISICLALVGIYSIIIRLQNPNLTETELFLKLIGG